MWLSRKFILVLGEDLFLAAHIGTECNGDVDRAVGAEVVLAEGDEHSGGSNDGVVEGVSKILALFLRVYADLEAACLSVAEVRARANLEILLLSGGPSLNVDGLDLEVCEVAGAALESTNGNIERAEEINSVLPELIEPHGGFLRTANNDHFLLFKLVDTVYSPFLYTVGSLFLAETG